ncbi:MAG: glutamine--fructose-6-phosphate transaminase (isomerizing) [Bryobacterales bacterium]|nr:glutamine--fructose-6-phosphate transaminase (isomerizing) [Bryobacterales bacterium]
MYGIIGYLGERSATAIILEGLRKLEYRGYDSAGIAVVTDSGELDVRHAAGKLRSLEDALQVRPLSGRTGIGHTRWASRRHASEVDEHPRVGPRGRVAVVHNGVVENYSALRRELESEGRVFTTESETELIAQLIEHFLEDDLATAVRLTVGRIRGSFALAVIAADEPQKIVVARLGPPLVVGLGQDEYFVASDVTPLLPYTRDMSFLSDGDIAVLTPDGVRLMDFAGKPISRAVSHVLWDPVMAEKGGFKHFMLKEIYEQPRAVRETFTSRIGLETGAIYLHEMELNPEELAAVAQIRIAACGTSWHAALAGKFMIEKLARIPVEVDYASEFRYRDPLIPSNTLAILVSQSGETADTLAAFREARDRSALTLAICNVPGSTLVREAGATLLTQAGPEIAVASTKAFSAQLTALFLFALYLARLRGTIPVSESLRLVRELALLPEKIEAAIALDDRVEAVAKLFYRSENFLFLGRGVHYPIALEGALKLKEVSYIHAEGYPAGEMKHGPNALIDGELPVVFLATRNMDSPPSRLAYAKILNAMYDIKGRGGIVLAVANEGDHAVEALCEHTLFVPEADGLLLPVLEVVPLQLLAYHIALRRGCDVDQPRNLAKSVTVE